MPHYIVKVAPDQDLYVDWSTITDCLWPSRYAGRRFLKRDLVMDPLDPDPYDKSPHVCALALFKDPLPAEVSS